MKTYTKEEVEKITLSALHHHDRSVFSRARLNVDSVYQWLDDLQHSEKWEEIPYHAQRFLIEGFNGILNHIRPTPEEIREMDEWDGD